MRSALCTGLLILALALVFGSACAETVLSPADLARDLSGILSENPPGFALVSADEKPSVSVDGHKGYRIVLRQEFPVFAVGRQQARMAEDDDVQPVVPTDIKVCHIDLVLFPETDKVASSLKERIKWQNLAQEYFVKPVYMGKGHGYHWFGRTTLFWQDRIRRKMKLSGGDNRVGLALEGMEVEDEGMMTRNSMSGIFRDLGDAAVPALQKAIKTHEKDDPYRYVSMLGCIETDRSTEALQRLCSSQIPEVSRAAAYVLATYSVRPDARREYLDMLRRGVQVAPVAAICAKHGWAEAVPDLERVMANPDTWWEFQSAYTAHRALTGRPVSDDVTRAASTFDWADKEGKDARSALVSTDDKEAAAVIIIGKYDRGGKISRDDQEMHNRDVLEMLSKLPIEIVRPLVETAARCTNSHDKERFARLLSGL